MKNYCQDNSKNYKKLIIYLRLKKEGKKNEEISNKKDNSNKQ